MAGNRLRLAVPAVFSDTGPKHFRADQRRDAAHHMHRRGTGKIMEAQLRQPAAAPDPVAGNRVDKCADRYAVNTIRDEFGPFRHSAGNNSGRRRAENGLEDKIHRGGNRQAEEAVILRHKGIKASDQRAGACEHQAETENPVNRGAESKVHQVFHNNIAGVFRPGKAGLHHSETRLHEKHQRRSKQRPNGVC